jgi:hypothetical protein
MIISSSEPTPRMVDEYDNIFVNGMAWPLTIDQEAGDSIDFQPERINVRIAGRPSPSDPSVKGPDEEQTLYTSNIIIVNHRKRVFTPAPFEQRVELQELIKQKASKTVH